MFNKNEAQTGFEVLKKMLSFRTLVTLALLFSISACAAIGSTKEEIVSSKATIAALRTEIAVIETQGPIAQATRANMVKNTATAIAPQQALVPESINDSVIYFTPGSTTGTGPKLGEYSCSGPILNVGLFDDDKNPTTPDMALAEMLTITHCIEGADSLAILSEGDDGIPGIILEQKTLDSIPNAKSEYPVIVLFKTYPKYIETLQSLDHNLKIANTPIITGSQEYVYCGFAGSLNDNSAYNPVKRCETFSFAGDYNGQNIMSGVATDHGDSGGPIANLTSTEISCVVYGLIDGLIGTDTRALCSPIPLDGQSIADQLWENQSPKP